MENEAQKGRQQDGMRERDDQLWGANQENRNSFGSGQNDMEQEDLNLSSGDSFDDGSWETDSHMSSGDSSEMMPYRSDRHNGQSQADSGPGSQGGEP